MSSAQLNLSRCAGVIFVWVGLLVATTATAAPEPQKPITSQRRGYDRSLSDLPRKRRAAGGAVGLP